MGHLLQLEGLDKKILVDSAGTYGGHKGELPDARMRHHAAIRGYELNHRSRKVVVSDFDHFDIIIAMDDNNFQDLSHLAPSPVDRSKIFRMADFLQTIQIDHVPDPYYQGAEGFEFVLDILEEACSTLLNIIKVLGSVERSNIITDNFANRNSA